MGTGWVTIALRTIVPNQHNLQQISLCPPDLCSHRIPPGSDPAHARHAVGEFYYRQWLEFDHLLAQLWESHSIRLKVLNCGPLGEKGDLRSSSVYNLFPEVTSRGIADFVGRGDM